MPPQQRQLHDEFFKRAKAEGYLARSAYKLLEINEKKHLIRRGDAVLDLGCAPGSWLQVSAKLVGSQGVVVGIDLQEIRATFPPYVHIVQGDIYNTPPEVLIGGMGVPFDVVISDMAPNTSGHGDDFLSVRLCRRMIELLPRLLKWGGHAVMKVLEGSEFPELLREVKAIFGIAGGYKPAASRDVSREMFIWAKGYRGIPLAPPTKHVERENQMPEEPKGVPLIAPTWNPNGWEVAPREDPAETEEVAMDITIAATKMAPTRKAKPRPEKKSVKKAAKTTKRSGTAAKKVVKTKSKPKVRVKKKASRK